MTIKKPELNRQLLLICFTAVLLITFTSFLICYNLLWSINKEENAIYRDQLENASIYVQAEFDGIEKTCFQLLQSEEMKKASAATSDSYELRSIYQSVTNELKQYGSIHGWAILFRYGNHVISNNGIYTKDFYNGIRFSDADYLDTFYSSIWNEFYLQIEPSTPITFRNSTGQYETQDLVLYVQKSYYKNNAAIVLFLDVDGFVNSTAPYLNNGAYLFFDDKLVFTSDEESILFAIPTSQTTRDENRTKYSIQSTQITDRITLHKLQPTNEVYAVFFRSLGLCIALGIITLLLIMVFAPKSMRYVMKPVNQVFDLLHKQSHTNASGITNSACSELMFILRDRDRKTKLIAEKDAVLSMYFLQSKLRNVFVDVETEEIPSEGDSYILYIRVHYQEKCRDYLTISAELENSLQAMMSDTLSHLFDVTMVFQLEPGRFAARVTLHDGALIDKKLNRFLDRLQIEQEFAYFTVIQSEVLKEGEDLAGIFSQVEDAFHLVKVMTCSQLIKLPLITPEEQEYIFSRADDQRIASLLSANEFERACTFIEELLDSNFKSGITYAQAEALCFTIVNSAARAATKLEFGSEKIVAASGTYTAITAQCNTSADYKTVVLRFIRSLNSANTAPQESDILLTKVHQYLQENYQREFSSEEMASALYVSRSYLSSYYKSKTGMNLSESIQIYRIQKAIELLKNTDIRISDIGPMVGISGSNTFLRWFKKYTGMTPKEYRLKNI